MKKYLQLIRYQNLLMIALMQIIFRYGFLKFQYVFLFLSDFHYILLILATVLIAAAGYIINDIMDQETDYYNKPDQLIVGKEITEKSAYNLYFALNIIGVLIGFYLANCIQKPSFAGIFILISATLYMYATTLKQMLLVGNIIVSILVSLTILLIGLFDLLPLTFDNNKREMAIIFSLLIDYAIFAFIINFIRELVKDLEDIEGDSNQDMSTLPIVLGLGKTAKVVSVVMILATILLLWYINQNLMTAGLYYAVIYGLLFIVSPLLFVAIKIWSASKREEFKRYSLLLKWIMFFGITSITFSILSITPVPTVTTANNGCLTNTGSISIAIPFYPLLSAIITAAPAGFPQPLPYDVSSFIDASGALNLPTVPLGDYVIQVTDTCPIVIPPISCTVPVYVNQGISADVRPGCDLQKTSLELTCANGKLTTVKITAAPPAFGQTYPYDVSANIISNGKLYLDNLPAGSYSFATLDECGFSNTITVNAIGYAITTSTFSLQPNCGSFNIPLNFVSNGTTNETYWLQKLINPVTDTWASPDYTLGNGVLYVNGSVPNATNSLALLNNATNFNLSYNGTFRIVRSFFSYNNGKSFNMGTVSDINKSCIEILSPTLNFQQSLEITNVTRMPCTTSGNLDVALLANGTAPLIYSIFTKDGLPFPVNNGTSNIFYNLPPGLYTFQVEDSCGNSTPITRDVSALLSIVTITKPQDLLLCKTNITGNEVFDLTQQSATILSSQSPTDYTLTYYATMADAMANTNAITNLTAYDPATNPATIYARLIFNGLPTCYEITTFAIIVGQIPKINLQPSYLNCAQFSITLDASPNNLPISTYAWSNGVSATTSTVTITQPGVTNVHLEVINTYGTLSCTNQSDTTVTLSEVPKIDHFETVDWTETENSITVFTSNTGDFEYSLDDINYQSSPLFGNLTPGLYTVYVRDRNGCGTALQQIWLLYYKRFFTPNGDGINDTWKIDNSKYETNLRIYIYDRYGKLMTSLNALEDGWDGTYNGQQMFSSDYWFEVFRQDGRVHRGHFSLKR